MSAPSPRLGVAHPTVVPTTCRSPRTAADDDSARATTDDDSARTAAPADDTPDKIDAPANDGSTAENR